MESSDREVIVLSDSDENVDEHVKKNGFEVGNLEESAPTACNPTLEFDTTHLREHNKTSNEDFKLDMQLSGPNAQKYSSKSSAYLQHLAEICFTILNDIRWNNNLFAWENGGDLSAVSAFSFSILAPFS